MSSYYCQFGLPELRRVYYYVDKQVEGKRYSFPRFDDTITLATWRQRCGEQDQRKAVSGWGHDDQDQWKTVSGWGHDDQDQWKTVSGWE
ncbi:hypothetical protein BDC45DRAFT_573749 [Circinella umbellata]|nr:hypothetical protein BDC45DRAFT_573749 [Circinella umbellata]